MYDVFLRSKIESKGDVTKANKKDYMNYYGEKLSFAR